MIFINILKSTHTIWTCSFLSTILYMLLIEWCQLLIWKVQMIHYSVPILFYRCCTDARAWEIDRSLKENSNSLFKKHVLLSINWVLGTSDQQHKPQNAGWCYYKSSEIWKGSWESQHLLRKWWVPPRPSRRANCLSVPPIHTLIYGNHCWLERQEE